MRTATDPDLTVSLTETIFCYEICGNDFAYNLICCALKKQLSLILVSLPEENGSGEFHWNHLQDLETGEENMVCHCLSFSPDTSLNCTPNNVMVCAAIGHDLKLFKTDLNHHYATQKLSGHSDFINDVAWVCEGELLASVSDDFTCRFWNINTNMENVITFTLLSAGMAIKSHPEDPLKVLVAEKRGIVHLYNVRSKQTVVSVESPKFPLMSADWAHSNRLFVTCLAAGNIFIWDLSRPFQPSEVKPVHEDGGYIVRFAPGSCSSEVVIASIGRPDLTLKVFAAKSTVPLVESPLKTYAGLAWHHRLPYISAVSDRKLLFWKVLVK